MDLGAKRMMREKVATGVRELAQRRSQAVEAAKGPMERDSESEWMEKQ